jgi:hypothetical protein
MNIRTTQSELRTILSDDPRFHIRDGFITAPRAGFEISTGCPVEYKIVLRECINNGWLKPVAHVTERELLFMGLSNE